MSAGTPIQEKRIKAAAFAWSVRGSVPTTPTEELLAILAEFHAAKSDICGYDDGYVPNVPALMKRFSRTTPKNESVSDRIALNKMEREGSAAKKAAKLAAREAASQQAKAARETGKGRSSSIHIAPAEAVLPMGVLVKIGGWAR